MALSIHYLLPDSCLMLLLAPSAVVLVIAGDVVEMVDGVKRNNTKL